MKAAKAILSFDQIGRLLEGKPVTLRLPEQLEHVPGASENVMRRTAGIEIELSRTPIPKGTHITYKVTSSSKNGTSYDLDMSYISQMVEEVDEMFDDLWAKFLRVFRLLPSK